YHMHMKHNRHAVLVSYPKSGIHWVNRGFEGTLYPRRWAKIGEMAFIPSCKGALHEDGYIIDDGLEMGLAPWTPKPASCLNIAADTEILRRMNPTYVTLPALVTSSYTPNAPLLT
ncbi:MAG TPA: hypothetical protein VFI27_21060, partial [candidate division Zixibacteria bacterium]|nr:hypothetical protein [candidate division Zixibacteria bacterium]